MEIVCPAWYPDAGSLIEAIPVLADQGVTAVEICTNYPRFGIHYPEYFDHRNALEVEALMSSLYSSGVRAHSVHAPFGVNYDISSPIDEIHERGVDALIEAIELANMVNAGIVVIHASHVLTNGVSKRLDRARGVLREVAIVAKESGLVIALENLPPGYLGQSPKEIFALLDGTDPDSVRLCFDSGHANMCGQFAKYAEELLPYAVSIHLHDNDGVRDHHLFPGQGAIDWLEFARIYHGTGCTASVMLECTPPDGMAWCETFQQFRHAIGE